MPGQKVPRVVGARVVYRDGVPLAASVGGRTEWLGEIDGETQRRAQCALDRGRSFPSAASWPEMADSPSG